MRGVVALVALIAAMLSPLQASAKSEAGPLPWADDIIYGCISQPLATFAVVPDLEKPEPETFKLDDSTPLPEGLNLDTQTGLITGEPKETFDKTITVTSTINPDESKHDFKVLIEEKCILVFKEIQPAEGPVEGGTEVVIIGEAFEKQTTVSIDNAGQMIPLTDVKLDDSTRLTAVMPPFGRAESVTLVIRNKDDSRIAAPTAFTYVSSRPVSPTQFLQPLIDGHPSFGTLIVGSAIADDPRRPDLGKVIRTDGAAGIFEVSQNPLIPDLAIRTRAGLNGTTISAVVGTPTASGPYTFTITSRVEGAEPDTYSFEFNGLVRYSTAQTVTFNGNGATSGFMATQSSDIKAALNTNAYARTGYTFNGWSTNPAGTGSVYLNNALYEFAANTTLYARWVAIPPVTHTITFNGNGATSGTMANQVSSAPAPVNANQYAKSGYIFEEWNTQADGGGSVYYPGDLYSFVLDATFYAIWKLPTPTGGDEGVFHTVTYDGNGATVGATASQTQKSQTAIRENGFIRPGYVFHAWNSTADHTGFEYEPGDYFNFSSDLKLYAQWDKIPPAAVVINVSNPLVIDLLAGESRTIIVKVANTAGALIPVTIEIPAGMLKVNSRVTIKPHATDASWAAGVIDLQIDFADASGKDISVLDAVLEIRFTTKLGLNSVGRSDDGLTWFGIPKLVGKTLPANQIDGYYLDAEGAAVILTRHLTEFGYKLVQAAVTATASNKTPVQVGLTTQITSTGGSGIGKFVYKSLTPTLCLSSQLGVVKALRVGTCSIQVTKNGDETFVQSVAKLVKFDVTPGVVVLAVKKAVVAKREVVVAATKVQIELGVANANKTVGFEISPTSNGLYKVIASVKLGKDGSASLTKTILKGTTIRVRLVGKTLTTYKFLGN
jgi:uncharacterized repeat protein (TIGR02543 family)